MRAAGWVGTAVGLVLVTGMAACGGGSTGTTTTIDSNSANANLAFLDVSQGARTPKFSASATSYKVILIGTASMTVTPAAYAAGAAIQVNGQTVASGSASGRLGRA